MNLSGIISVSGMPGLYKVVAQTKNGLIVESLIDKKRIPTYTSHKISALEDISVYSTGEDVPLKEVLKKIYEKEKGGAAIDHKASEKELTNYFTDVFSEYDKERVYISDIKKIISWYNILQKQDLLKAEPEKKEETEENKPKVKAGTEKTKTVAKAKLKDTSVKPVKTSAPKVKTQTTRKTGAA